MTKYIVTTQEGEFPRYGLSLAEAADQILSSDSRQWEIRLRNGNFEIWSRQQCANVKWAPIYTLLADNFEEACLEAYNWAIDLDWRGYDIAVEELAKAEDMI